MKTTIYVLITISVILMIALLYATTKLQNTEMRRQSSAAKAEAMKRENQQLNRRLESRQSVQLLLSARAVPDGVQAIFDEHEQTITDLEARLAAATAENEALRKQLRPFELPGSFPLQYPAIGKVCKNDIDARDPVCPVGVRPWP